MKKTLIAFLFIINYCNFLQAQDLIDVEKQFSGFLDKKFKLQTFQIYQFMDRFNFDEKIQIDNTPPSRKSNLLLVLNHKDTTLINSPVTKEFINTLTSDSDILKLKYADKNWYALVKSSYYYKNKKVIVQLKMLFNKDAYGYRWVIDSVGGSFFKQPDSDYSLYLNPLNNEVNFSELSTVLEGNNSIWSYTENKQYNALSSFYDYIKNKDLVFVDIESIQYHFNNYMGYNFTVDYFMRNDMNAGWLISSINKFN